MGEATKKRPLVWPCFVLVLLSSSMHVLGPPPISANSIGLLGLLLLGWEWKHRRGLARSSCWGLCALCATFWIKRRPHSRMGRVIHTGARSPGPWSRSRPNLESRNGSVTPDALHPHAGCNFGPKVACKRFCCPIRASQRLGPETKWYAPSPGFPLDHRFGLAEPRKTPKVLRSFEIGRMSLLIPCRPLRAYLHGQ